MPFAPTVLAPVPPLVTANCPVQPRVILAARNNDVAGAPPNVIVTLVSSVFVSAAPVTSAPSIVAHEGAFETTPVPVCERYCLTAVILPASFERVLAAEE